MENLHNNQAQSADQATLLAITGGDPIGFYTHNIQREEERVRELVERLVNEACPAGMAKMLEQMISCVQVLQEETSVITSELMDDVWRLANLNHLLVQLHASKKRIGSYEEHMALWKQQPAHRHTPE